MKVFKNISLITEKPRRNLNIGVPKTETNLMNYSPN